MLCVGKNLWWARVLPTVASQPQTGLAAYRGLRLRESLEILQTSSVYVHRPQGRNRRPRALRKYGQSSLAFPVVHHAPDRTGQGRRGLPGSGNHLRANIRRDWFPHAECPPMDENSGGRNVRSHGA